MNKEMLLIPDNNGNSPVKMAIYKGRLDVAKRIMEITPNPINVDKELIVEANARENTVSGAFASLFTRFLIDNMSSQTTLTN